MFEQNLLSAFVMQTELNKIENSEIIPLQFLTSGITGCIVFWLQENKPIPPKKAATILSDYLEEQGLLAPFIPNP